MSPDIHVLSASTCDNYERYIVWYRGNYIYCKGHDRAWGIASKLVLRPYLIGNGSLTQSQYDDINSEWLACDEVEPVGIGNSRFWMLPFTHPFFLPAMLHDMDYPNNDGLLLHNRNRLQCDRLFLRRCIAVAREHDSEKLYMLAWTLYGIVRQFGGLCWKEGTGHRLPERLAALVESQRVQLAGLVNFEMLEQNLNDGGIIAV